MNKLLSTLVVSTSMVLPVAQAFAQTTGTTTTDPAVTAAQNQQALLDAQLKIQQDQQALLTGSLPTSSATPSTGAFSVSGTYPFPSEKLAYEQLKGTARTLATAMSNTTGPIVIYDSTEINNLVNYNALSATLDLLDTQANAQTAAYSELHLKAVALEKLQPAPESQKDFAPILAPGLILSGLKTVSDIVGMFRTNTTVAYNSFTADDVALTAAVANELLLVGKKTVYLPAQMPLNLSGGPSKITNTLGAIQKKLFDLQNQISKDQANVQQISDALGLYIAADQAGQANTDVITGETDKTKKQAELVKQKSLDRMTSAAKAYVLMLYGATATDPMDPSIANVNKAVVDQFLKRVALVYTSVSAASTAFSSVQSNLDAVSTGGISSLSAILRAEALLAQVKSVGATVLSVKTSVLGGGVVTRLNLFTGGHLLYTGGAIVNYMVFDVSGKIVMSGVLVCDDASKSVKY